MRKVDRVPLSAATMIALSNLTGDVAGAADRKTRAAALWKTKPKEAFSDVRAKLQKMAGGLERCMYCENNEGTDIEHFWPKSLYPDKAYSWSNYLLACSHCNSNHKRKLFPLTSGEPDLLDPSVDEPSHHLRLVPSNGKYLAIGPKVEPSIKVFDLNGEVRGRRLPKGRSNTFNTLQSLLLDYDDLIGRGDHARAHVTKRSIMDEPFPAVLHFLVQVSRQPDAEEVLRPGVVQAIVRHRVAGW
jgi:uncharacterized protein (TIGR02646 family)